jgi:hypothetical protein
MHDGVLLYVRMALAGRATLARDGLRRPRGALTRRNSGRRLIRAPALSKTGKQRQGHADPAPAPAYAACAAKGIRPRPRF